jgi:hypothetical protein
MLSPSNPPCKIAARANCGMLTVIILLSSPALERETTRGKRRHQVCNIFDRIRGAILPNLQISQSTKMVGRSLTSKDSTGFREANLSGLIFGSNPLAAGKISSAREV